MTEKMPPESTSGLKIVKSCFRPEKQERDPSERRTLLRLLLQLCLLIALGFDIINYDVDFSVSENSPALTAQNGLLDGYFGGSANSLGISIDSVILPANVVRTPSNRAPPA